MKKLSRPISELTSEQIKHYLHKRIMEDRISVFSTNQTISAYKTLQTDVFRRKWESFKIKQPRRGRKLPWIVP
ncbi:MAG: hypothetical protein RBS19_01380 [Bacteroidales bacterium]|nr:hypothetical protein [Bacteroidales bacterium]